MKKIEIKDPDKRAETGSYSAALKAGSFVFVSGQGPLDPQTGAVLAGTIQEETRLTLANMERVLAAAGCTLENVVQCTCYLADIADFDSFDRVYGSVFTGVRPVRTTVQAGLAGIKVEIDCMAIAEA